MSPDVKETIKKYKSGELHWLEAAPDIEKLLEELIAGPGQGTVLNYGLAVHAARDMVSSYRFLRTRRPEILKNPKNFQISFYVIAYLPILYSKLKDTDRGKTFDDLIDRTLKGEMSINKMQKLSRSLNDSSHKMTTAKNDSKQSSNSLKIFGDCLNLMRHMAEEVLENGTYKQLRALYSAQCDQLAIQLNCIADEEFMSNWEKRREEKV